MTEGIPSHLQPVFDRLHHDFVMLQVRWQMYRQLYGTNEQRVKLLNAVASGFFGTVHAVLLDDVLGGVARLSDSVSTCGKDNLVLKQLLTGVEYHTDANYRARLVEKLNAVNEACEPIRKVRNKRLAHRDLGTALDPSSNPLPPISRAVVQKSLDAIADYLNLFQSHFTNNTIMYSGTITPMGDGDGLVRALRRIIEHRTLEKRGLVPHVGELSKEYEDA